MIPKSLASKLEPLGPHFIRMGKKGKNPIDLGWNTNPMSHNDMKLQEWLKEGGNYGVVGGFGIVIVEIDLQDLKAIVKEKLPETYTVESPGHKGWHLYYIASIENAIRLRDKDGENIGDIQGQGKCVVGPESTHPNGKIYKVIVDKPLAQVTREQLIEAFKEFVIPDQEIEQVSTAARMERTHNIDIPLTRMLSLGGLRKRGDEYWGAHPTHGSKGGMNFWINTRKGVWHCFRHKSGGGSLLWLAVQEGIINCADARSGALRGEVFKQLLKVAVEHGYIDEDKVNLKKYGATSPLGDFYLEQRGPKVFLFAKDGEVITSCNIGSVDGPRFKKLLKDKTNVEEDVIQKATATLLLNATERMGTTKPKEDSETFSEETKAKALALLEDPAFFYKLGCVFSKGFVVSKLNKPRFIVGEERNKRLLGLLLIGSTKLNMTSITKVLGDPATAKDSMLRMWLDILPIKSIERSYFTAASLRYSEEMQEADLLYIPDSPDMKGEMGRQMRFMRADDGGLVSEYALKDKETGEMTTKVVTLPIKGIATTSNAITGDRALESGMWTLHTNSKEGLTHNVKMEKLRLRAGKRKLFPPDELKVWKCAFQILAEDIPDAMPIIEFAEELIKILESTRSESRRDPDKLCDLISLVAWARRFQKLYEEADLTDLYFALQIGLDAITQTISDLDEKEQRTFEAVKNLGVASCRDVVNITKIPYRTTFRYLEKLLDKGWVNKDKPKGKNIYTVLIESAPKILAIGNGANSEDPEALMNFILKSFKTLPTCQGGTSIVLIDPLTGNEVTVKVGNDNTKVSIENKVYSYPYGKVTKPKQSPKQPSKAEQTPKPLAPSPMASEKQAKLPQGPIPLGNVTNELTDFNIISCVWLDDPSVGKCANCKDTGTLPYQVENTKKEFGFCCKRCGEFFLELIEKQRKVD